MISSPMSPEPFFDGFFAALRLRGVEFVDTEEGRHHDRFRKVAEMLESDEAVPESMSVFFVPSPFNGDFQELDAALINSQVRWSAAKNPYYPGVHLLIDEGEATEILTQFSDDEATAFKALADIFSGSEPSSSQTAIAG